MRPGVKEALLAAAAMICDYGEFLHVRVSCDTISPISNYPGYTELDSGSRLIKKYLGIPNSYKRITRDDEFRSEGTSTRPRPRRRGWSRPKRSAENHSMHACSP